MRKDNPNEWTKPKVKSSETKILPNFYSNTVLKNSNPNKKKRRCDGLEN